MTNEEREGDMTETEEAAYRRGERAALCGIMADCMRRLGYESTTVERLAEEREDAIAMLRDLCDDFGDNDWSDGLHLADIIDKHLGKHLHEADL